MVAVFS